MMGVRFTVRLWGLALAGSFMAATMALAAPAQAASASHLWAWGNGSSGQLGIGTAGVRVAPVPVGGLGTSGVRQVVAPNFFGPVVALTADGTVWAWGPGPLGNGSSSSTGITSPVTSVVSGQYQASGQNSIVAVGADGSLWSWGYSGFGATGSGGSGASPGRVPRVPSAHAVYDLEGSTWFAAV
jgi:alpha-tubulin suppressor-like RCC1 family protein